MLAFHSQLPNFVLLRAVGGAGRRLPETASPGRGEAEAITLAKEINADLLLTDDLKARAIAASLETTQINPFPGEVAGWRIGRRP